MRVGAKSCCVGQCGSPGCMREKEKLRMCSRLVKVHTKTTPDSCYSLGPEQVHQ